MLQGVQSKWEGELSSLMVSTLGSSMNHVPLPSLPLLMVPGSRHQQPVWETMLRTGLGFTHFTTALRALPNTGER